MKKYYFIFTFMILLTIISGCESLQELLATDVEYTVTGTTTTVNITIANEDGGTSQFFNVTIPWSYEFQGRKGDLVSVSAHNLQASGSVTVTIYTDGSVFKTSTNEGAYVIATASGLLP